MQGNIANTDSSGGKSQGGAGGNVSFSHVSSLSLVFSTDSDQPRSNRAKLKETAVRASRQRRARVVRVRRATSPAQTWADPTGIPTRPISPSHFRFPRCAATCQAPTTSATRSPDKSRCIYYSIAIAVCEFGVGRTAERELL